MNKYDEVQFIFKMCLERLKQKPNGWVARCQVCGDSVTNPSKTRLNILSGKGDHLVFHCFNCGLSTNMAGYLRLTNTVLYDEYKSLERKEALESGTVFKKKLNESSSLPEINIKYLFNFNNKYFTPAKNFKEHTEYCKKRHIEDHLDKFYVNTNKDSIFYNMLIIPFYKNNKIYGFQGRSIDRKMFATFSTNANAKIYGLFDIDKHETVYITESIIDSMMLDNSIAMVGADLTNGASKEIKNRVFCYDNDLTGYQRSLKMVENNEKVYIWPDNLRIKDFNEGITTGSFTKNSLKSIIDNNTFEGINALTRLKIKMMKKQRG